MARLKIRIGQRSLNDDIADICSYGKWNKQLGDKLCAFLFAVSPLLQHYKGLYKDAGFTAYLIILPWMLLRLLQMGCHKKIQSRHVVTFPLVAYFAFSSVIHGITVSKLLYNGFMIFLCVLFEFGCFNVRYIFRYASYVCGFASLVLVIQYFCYYVLGFHLCIVPVSALLEESSQWVAGAQTGLINIRGASNGFYRPSAFFLEPSHMFIYCFPVLCICLFSKGMTKSRLIFALLISLGILLSTSGMGIVCCLGVWVCYYLLYYDKTNANIAKVKNIFSARNLLIVSGVILFVVILYFSVDSVANTVNRILSSGSSSAFSGRLGQASKLVKGLSGKSLLVGLTDDASNITYNLPGFFATLYKKGVIGVLLSYWFYAKGLFKLKAAGFWMSFIILILSFFSAHTHGTFYMMFFVSLLMEEYRR